MRIKGSAWNGQCGWRTGEWEILIDSWIDDLKIGEGRGGWIGVRDDGEWGWVVPESITEWIDKKMLKRFWRGISFCFNNNIENGIQKEEVIWEPILRNSWGWVYDGGYVHWRDILGIVVGGEILIGEEEERVLRGYDLSGVKIRNNGWLRIEDCSGKDLGIECFGDWSLVVVGSEFRNLKMVCSGICHRFWWWGGEIINDEGGFVWDSEILGEGVFERAILVGEDFGTKRLEEYGFKMINILTEK